MTCEDEYLIANAIGNRTTLPVPFAITFAGASASDVSCNATDNVAPDSIGVLEPPGNVTRPRIIYVAGAAS